MALVSVGPRQNEAGWRQLENTLRAALGEIDVPRNLRALGLVTAGLLLMAFLVLAIAHDPQVVAQAMFEMIRL
jgi:hypothetical protein